jgi:hypothetical protein
MRRAAGGAALLKWTQQQGRQRKRDAGGRRTPPPPPPPPRAHVRLAASTFNRFALVLFRGAYVVTWSLQLVGVSSRVVEVSEYLKEGIGGCGEELMCGRPMCELREFGSLLFPASCALSVSGRLVEFLVLFVADDAGRGERG